MCGIVGSYGEWAAGQHGSADVSAMARTISHRGPDAQGEHRFGAGDNAVHLGHLRLSIIDLSDVSNQPMIKNGLSMVYNGEIYNYQELRRELQALGATFITSGDTEVVLEAWRHWGPESLNKLRGMFAFAIHEEATNRLVLARDHYGIKPLFYAAERGKLLFGSELKAVTHGLPNSPTIDFTAVVASLLYYWIPEKQCVYKEVQKLQAGTWLEITPGADPRVHTYYDASIELTKPIDNPVDAEELRHILEESVKAHLIADVPVSVFLSGGLDSSLITMLANREIDDLDAYTIAFRSEDQALESMPDDLHYARMLADDNGIKLNEIEISPDIADTLPQMTRILDEPIGDVAAINAWLICKEAREAGVKVLLSGMGADEIFGGYRKHYANLLAAQYRRVPGPLRHKMVGPVVDRLPVAGRTRGYVSVRWAKRFLSFAELPEEAAFRRSYTHYAPDELQSLLAPELGGCVEQLVREHAEVYAEGPADDHVNRMCYADTRMFLPSLNLAYTDRASMAASTEVRVPFVDREVIEAAFRVPGSAKIIGQSRKDILKKAAEPILPPQIANRPKAPFSAPLRAWIRRDLREMVDDLLGNGQLVSEGIVDRQSVRQMIDDDRAGVEDRSKEIWQLLTLETWWTQQSEDMTAAVTAGT